MNRSALFRWGLILTTIILLYFSFVVVRPFLVTMLLALIVTFVFHPIYRFFNKKLPEMPSSFLTLFSVLLIVVIPLSILITRLVREAANAYRTFLDLNIDLSNAPFIGGTALAQQLQTAIDGLAAQTRDFIVLQTPNILGEITWALIHLIVFFAVMYFANIQGHTWYSLTKKLIPLRPEVKKHLFDDLEKVVYGMVYGQFLTAVAQGIAGGLLFFIFGVPNPIFWGFVMIFLSFIPLVGVSFLILPTALFYILQNDYITGFGLLIFGLVIVANVDNLLRPYLVNRFAPVHTLIVIIGVLGGIQAFGFAGMFIGPLILALFFTLIKDFSRHKELLAEDL